MAGRKCGICLHSKRGLIDAAIASGGSQAAVSARFKISGDALGRHIRGGHITVASIAAGGAVQTDAAPSAGLPDVLATLVASVPRLVRLLDNLERLGQASAFVAASRELRQSLETIAKMTGALRSDGSLAGQQGHQAVIDEDAARERILAKLDAIAACHDDD
jgi:hypothetical protein